MPTMRDVAQLAQVDISTVSRVLSDDPAQRVSVETRQRIIDVVDELRYRPNAAARTLRTARSGTVGLVIPDISPVYAEIVKGAQEEAAHLGLAILLASDGVGTTTDYRALYEEGRIDGLIVATARRRPFGLKQLQSAGPVVLVNRRTSANVPYVVVDDAGGARMATRYLLDAGHRAIVYLDGDPDADTSHRRRRGFESEIQKFSGAVPIVEPSGFDERSGYEAGVRLLRVKPEFTAVLAASSRAAIGFLAAARAADVAVPDEVSVIGIHDTTAAEFAWPPLTVVRLPLQDMGKNAVQVLSLLLTGEPVASLTIGEPIDLIERESVRTLN
ncbi:MAG: LacI family DNA-binding transcriptional regulator [Acidobacteria bacterium]|nr:LacI family DNA-binding transcriptional regulator [Acidobacteriota bacterium]